MVRLRNKQDLCKHIIKLYNKIFWLSDKEPVILDSLLSLPENGKLLRSRGWIEILRPENDSTRLHYNGNIYQLLLAAASSNLVGGK